MKFRIRPSLPFLFTVMLFTTQMTVGQYFIWGNEPGMKWKERSTSNLTLIFPESYTADTSFIRYFDSAIVYQTHLLSAVPRRLNIVLHPNTLISNGFVAWAPARSELFTVPARDFYPGYWPQQLAWHEMRHFAQYSVAHKQLKKRIGWLFGEYLTVGMMGLVVPSWFIEGDATASETSFLNTGRGRSTSFSAPLFAWLNDQKNLPDYDQCVLGSYQNYSPNQYLYGYWMVARGQQSFGSAFWTGVYAETFMKSNFGMFPRTFKKTNHRNLALHRFHNETMQWLKESVQTDLAAAKLTITTVVTNTDHYCNYRPLGCDTTGNIIAYRTSLHGEPCFVSISESGIEKILHFTNYVHDESFGFDGQHIYYSEYRPQERWEMVDYARTLQLDIVSGKVENLSETYKELLPAISPGGNALATCTYRNNGTYLVTVTALPNGQTLGWAEFPYNQQPISLAVDNEARNLYLILQTVYDRRIVRYNGTSKTSELLFNSVNRNIGSLILINDYLYFNSSINGNEEIYRIPTSGGVPECITNTAFGAYYPVADGSGGLYFSELTSNGFQIRHLNIITKCEPVTRWQFMYELADTLSLQTAQLCDSVNTVPFEIADSKPYSKGKHLINVHSWGPVTIDPSSQSINPGIQFDSQNLLSTLTTSIFSGYNLSTATIESGISTTFQGWYPMLSLGYTNYLPFDNGSVNYAYHSLNLSALLPLVYTKNAWTFRITPQLETRPLCAIDTGDGMMGYARYGAFLSFSAYKYTNGFNLYPKLGAFFGGGALWQSFDNHKGLMYAGIGGVWLPGVFCHDGFRFRGGYELRDTLALPFTTMMSGPRNYNLLQYPIESFVSGEYATPLLYPDMHIGSLVFVKRINGMISYDYGITKNDQRISSIGFHLMTDAHFLRLYAPVRLVFSEYYMQPANRWSFQFGLSYDLYAY